MELNPKVFLARERGLKAGFSVSPSLYIPPPSFHFIPIFQPPVSPFHRINYHWLSSFPSSRGILQLRMPQNPQALHRVIDLVSRKSPI